MLPGLRLIAASFLCGFIVVFVGLRQVASLHNIHEALPIVAAQAAPAGAIGPRGTPGPAPVLYDMRFVASAIAPQLASLAERAPPASFAERLAPDALVVAPDSGPPNESSGAYTPPGAMPGADALAALDPKSALAAVAAPVPSAAESVLDQPAPVASEPPAPMATDGPAPEPKTAAVTPQTSVEPEPTPTPEPDAGVMAPQAPAAEEPAATPKLKAAAITPEPEPAALTSEPKAAAIPPESMPATITPEPKAAAIAPEPEPAALTSEPKAAVIPPESMPATITPEPKAAAITQEPKAAAIAPKSSISAAITPKPKSPQPVILESKPRQAKTIRNVAIKHPRRRLVRRQPAVMEQPGSPAPAVSARAPQLAKAAPNALINPVRKRRVHMVRRAVASPQAQPFALTTRYGESFGGSR